VDNYLFPFQGHPPRLEPRMDENGYETTPTGLVATHAKATRSSALRATTGVARG
jgi:hypothetical protein